MWVVILFIVFPLITAWADEKSMYGSDDED